MHREGFSLLAIAAALIWLMYLLIDYRRTVEGIRAGNGVIPERLRPHLLRFCAS